MGSLCPKLVGYESIGACLPQPKTESLPNRIFATTLVRFVVVKLTPYNSTSSSNRGADYSLGHWSSSILRLRNISRVERRSAREVKEWEEKGGMRRRQNKVPRQSLLKFSPLLTECTGAAPLAPLAQCDNYPLAAIICCAPASFMHLASEWAPVCALCDWNKQMV